eukprot:maker-scaffold661_size154698-snap-gene-0.19 protein:Tk09489 transcript:maker-scaffold661_size154698-snap-gene-0.19-mRNA-1 annotation:"pancreatic triacylglycerol lipase-like"
MYRGQLLLMNRVKNHHGCLQSVDLYHLGGQTPQHKLDVDFEEDKVKFYIWTTDNLSVEDLIHPCSMMHDLSSSHFKAGQPIKILIHGFSDNGKTGWVTGFKDKFLKADDVNVISIDWSEWAGTSIFSYPSAVLNTKRTANAAKVLVNSLVDIGASMEDIHVIGFSLGAHVAGYLGQKVKGQLQRVTGLDPAAPMFRLSNNRINRRSAQFVDIIHTSGGFTSLEEPLGHADFYPNSGVHPQPGCENDTSLDHKCSHFRAFKFYEESIGSNGAFSSKACRNWMDFQYNKCDPDHASRLGDGARGGKHGKFYLRTNPEPPYSIETWEMPYNQSHISSQTELMHPAKPAPHSILWWNFLIHLSSWLD